MECRCNKDVTANLSGSARNADVSDQAVACVAAGLFVSAAGPWHGAKKKKNHKKRKTAFCSNLAFSGLLASVLLLLISFLLVTQD